MEFQLLRRRAGVTLRCPYCHVDVADAEDRRACDACDAPHHRECWSEHGACSACGAKGDDALERALGQKRVFRRLLAALPSEEQALARACRRYHRAARLKEVETWGAIVLWALATLMAAVTLGVVIDRGWVGLAPGFVVLIVGFISWHLRCEVAARLETEDPIFRFAAGFLNEVELRAPNKGGGFLRAIAWRLFRGAASDTQAFRSWLHKALRVQGIAEVQAALHQLSEAEELRAPAQESSVSSTASKG